MSLNSVTISGHLTQNINLKATPSGLSVLEFCIVVDERKRKQDGTWESIPNFINCTMFGARAESLSKIFEKGMKVAAHGKLRYESWEKDGQKRSSTTVIVDEVEILSQRSGLERTQPSNADTYTAQQQNAAYDASGAFSGGVSEYAEEYYQESIPF